MIRIREKSRIRRPRPPPHTQTHAYYTKMSHCLGNKSALCFYFGFYDIKRVYFIHAEETQMQNLSPARAPEKDDKGPVKLTEEEPSEGSRWGRC